ncbi:hypothetical protein PLESTM_000762100 [Pleodorina starrii]|nr:hypothetical protein PLESTM_000762100 [Pleodorina starrii]
MLGTAGVWPSGGPTLEALHAAATAAVGRSTGPTGWTPPLGGNPWTFGASAAWDRGLAGHCYPDGRLRRGNVMFGVQYVDAQGARGCRLAT